MMNTRFYLCSWLGFPVYAWLTSAQAHDPDNADTVAVFEEKGGEMKMYDARMKDLVVEEVA